MAIVKKTESVEEVKNATKSMEKKVSDKQVSDNTLNKDGLVAGKALTQEEYSRFKAKYK